MSESGTAPGRWAVLELMGHRQAIGRITETDLAGKTMLAVERIDTEPEGVTQYYGPESVYCMTPVTEDQARQIAGQRYKTRLIPAAIEAAAAIPDDDDEEVWGFTEEDQ